MRILVLSLLAAGLATDAAPNKAADAAPNKAADAAPVQAPRDMNREMARLVREMQLALEGGSARALLALIDSAKFDDYPRFEDMIERLMRENTIRAHFASVSTASKSPAGSPERVQAVLDSEMELSRKDAVGQVVRRRGQLVLDVEATRRGWRITNITPRHYFEPL